ncbi:single-stranded DNA binding protein [Halocatena halophila]|uniref:single-stranded DNA binding protein n=1 Tax=Halocatena halophila TaxID=2814576 RepID=UPI002ED28A50
MSEIEDIYAELDVDISEEEFREAVEAKVEEMAGLADEATAAQLVSHSLGGGEPSSISAIEPGPAEVSFAGKVVGIGDLRTFERDDEDEPGHVINLDVADETGQLRVALWDDEAIAATDELERGQVLKIKGRPKEGYAGVEVSANRLEPAPDTEIDVSADDTTAIESLSMGQSDVTLTARLLGTEPVRTFERDDGSEGKVSNLVVGDETGRIRVTLWDDQADTAETLTTGESIEIVDGYVRERDGDLELHVGSRGSIDEIDEEISFVPDTTPIEALEIEETVDIAGVVRSSDPKRTFDRDDGSEGQVRNVRIQDQTGDIRVALWGEKADLDLTPGDEVLFGDVEIQDGWQDSIEASAGWQSTVSPLDPGTTLDDGDSDPSTDSEGLEAFTETGESSQSTNTDTDMNTDTESGEHTEFTGTVVQTGEPVILDNGESTLTVETTEDVRLGQEITVRGRMVGEKLAADELF